LTNSNKSEIMSEQLIFKYQLYFAIWVANTL